MSRAFPILTRNAAGELLVFHACFGIEPWPPHRRQMVLLAGAPGPLRPDLIHFADGSRHLVLQWMAQDKIPAADAEAIVEAAENQEKTCQERMRRRHEENFGTRNEKGRP